jgi:(p)ppGpp synthase/HD superfamily hydrolase
VISVGEADALALRAHGDSRSRSGSLFIEHVRRVAARVASEPDSYAMVAALLHDTVEKGAMEWADLWAAGADARLVALVDALTERDGESDRDYLARCAADPLAFRIKRADIEDKLEHAHSTLTTDAIRILRARAHQRLALLEQLASGDD